MQRLAFAPLTPRTKRIRDLEAMVESQNCKFRSTIIEAQGLIDKANVEARALQREKDEARWYKARAPPPGPLASLPAMPTPFEFGGCNSDPLSGASPVMVPPPHHPPPPFPSPPMGFGSMGGGVSHETPFLSARGSLLSHVEISREVRKNREEQEERKRGTALSNTANKWVNAELVDLQITWLQVQARLNEYFGAGQVPATIQDAINFGEAQLTASRQGLRIQESHGISLAAQFRGHPLLTSEEQTRLCSLVKDQKDKQALTKGGGGSRGGGRSLGVRGGKVNPPGAGGVLCGVQAVCIWFIPIDCLICLLRTIVRWRVIFHYDQFFRVCSGLTLHNDQFYYNYFSYVFKSRQFVTNY